MARLERWWPEQEGDVPARPLFSAASHYLAIGWQPTPITPGTKVPAKKHWAAFGQNMHYDAMVEIWDRDDAPSVGLVTGFKFDVLDLDGMEGLAALHDHLVPLGIRFKPTGPVAITGRGGRHVLFQPTGYGNRGHMLQNVDFRGAGGFVVAPPSLHENGNTYRWHPDFDYDLLLPPAPRWLLDLLERTKSQETDGTGDGLDHGSVSEALTAARIDFRRDGPRVVFRCPTGRHNDSEWSAKTGLGIVADRKWKCFGCDAWGDAENIRDETHVWRGARYPNT